MGKSVNPFSTTQVDYKWMMKTFKYCAKCGAACVLDTIDNLTPEYDTKTGKQYVMRYWGCPTYNYEPLKFNQHTSYVIGGPPDYA